MQQRIIGAMRGIGALGLAVWLGACGVFGKSEVTPSAQEQPAVASSDWPPTPVSAFRPAAGGTCPASYTLTHGTCVHAAMRSRVSQAELEKRIAAYRAGAASPRVGGGPAPAELPETVATLDADDPTKLPPDAFTKKRLDAEAVKAARLAELETLIRNARIRAGENVDAEPSTGVNMMDPQAQNAAKRRGETTKLSEMTEGLPPEVQKAVLVEIKRNGGTALVSLEELQALEAQAQRAEAERAAK